MELSRTTKAQYEKLKKLGFPINKTSKHPTPTLAFALKWLRDKKNIVVLPALATDTQSYDVKIYILRKEYAHIEVSMKGWYPTFERAELHGLDEAINHLLANPKNRNCKIKF